MIRLKRCSCCKAIKIKPCPFCGARDPRIREYTSWYLLCKKCGASGASKGNEKRAIEAWNKRVI